MVVRAPGLVALLLAGCGAANHTTPPGTPTRVDSDRPTPNLSYFPPPPTGDVAQWDHDTPAAKASVPSSECAAPRSPDEMGLLEGALRRCYQMSLADDPEREGKVSVELVVDATGHVLSARATQSTVPISLEACAVQAFASRRYTPGPPGCTSKFVLFARFQRQRPSDR